MWNYIAILGRGGANIVLNEKTDHKWKLRELKLRGFGQNQMSTPNLITVI